MTDLAFRTHTPALTAPAVWSGRILSGVIGGFLGLEGLTRLVTGEPLVAASGTAPVLAPAVQTGLGAFMLAGAALYLLRPARLFGAALLLLCLTGLAAVEAAASVRSPADMLFWTYVGALVVAGLALRRSSILH